MSDDELKLQALLNECNSRLSEISETIKSVHRAFFAFITVGAAVIGLYFNDKIVADAGIRLTILFLLTQAQVLLSLFMCSMWSMVTVNSAYLRALGDRLNALCKEPVSLWNREIAAKFLWRPRRAFFLSVVGMTAFVAVLDVTFVALAFWSLQLLYAVVLALEMVFVLGLALLQAKDGKDATLYARKRLGVQNMSSSLTAPEVDCGEQPPERDK